MPAKQKNYDPQTISFNKKVLFNLLAIMPVNKYYNGQTIDPVIYRIVEKLTPFEVKQGSYNFSVSTVNMGCIKGVSADDLKAVLDYYYFLKPR